MVNTIQGIPQQPGTGQIACLIAFFPGYFVFNNENAQSGNQNKWAHNEYFLILHLFRIFFIGKGSFYQTLGMARKHSCPSTLGLSPPT